MLSNEQGNDLIKNKIEEGEVFSVGRVGRVELCATVGDSTGGHADLIRSNAGIYGGEKDLSAFRKFYLDSIVNSDIQIFWDAPDFAPLQTEVFSAFCPMAILVDSRSVEPFYFDNPWSTALESKRVLIIHPFDKSINNQYEKRNLLWENQGMLPDFDLVTYQSVQSVGNSGPDSGWLESFNRMKDDILNLEFDVALLGCGGYGMPLTTFIKKEMNKPAIYIGGGLQILFGIKGHRWDEHDTISKFYNEHWVRPLTEERPNTADVVEGGCYW